VLFCGILTIHLLTAAFSMNLDLRYQDHSEPILGCAPAGNAHLSP
jgi:hypothetical protein